jgi:high affinity Mn2+ porin
MKFCKLHAFGCASLILFAANALAQGGVSPSIKSETPASSVSVSDEKILQFSEWSIHFQATSITQMHSYFHSAYSGQNSLLSNYEIPSTGTATLFIGHKLWANAALYANPEESMGSGIASTHGIAAFPNGESFRVDDPNPLTSLSRLFIQQEFGFGGPKEKVEDDLNQFSGEKDIERLNVVAGKFSLNDYFDNNSYSYDPRAQFLNWALMDTGAWDYAADTRGYTWGVMTELHEAQWSIRASIAQVPVTANGTKLEGDLTHAHAENVEAEYRYRIYEKPGKLRVLYFSNQAHMGSYREAINLGQKTSMVPDVSVTRAYRTKFGFGVNLEQELTLDLGVFSRIGYNDGATETWSFTEIDRSISVGASLKGTVWKRQSDVIGLAFMWDGLSQDHQDYLAAKGLGFLIGDGGLSYAPEEVIEAYYCYQFLKELSFTLDFQGVNHPAFNTDRGPVAIYGLRVHYEI